MKNIFFDLWGTLIYLEPGEDFIFRIAEKIGLNKQNYMEQVKSIWYRQNISPEEFADYLLKRFDAKSSNDEIVSWLRNPIERARLFPEVLTSLTRLKEDNELYLVSDTGSVGREIIGNLDLERFFSMIFLSNERGITKKEGLYKLSFDKANKKPSDCLVIGDSLERDYKIPLNLKAKTILIDRYNRYSAYDCIRTLEEIS